MDFRVIKWKFIFANVTVPVDFIPRLGRIYDPCKARSMTILVDILHGQWRNDNADYALFGRIRLRIPSH